MVESASCGEHHAAAKVPNCPRTARVRGQPAALAVRRALLVTRGERGSARVVRRARGLARKEFAARVSGPLVDPTGCGDSFLAGVVGARVLGLNPDASVRFGAWVAGRVATLRGLAALRSLAGLRQRAAEADPEFRPLVREGPAGTPEGTG